MKTHGHYETSSAIKQMTELIGSLVGDTVHSHKVRIVMIRSKKRLYRQSRPKKTRCIAEVQNGKDIS